MTIEIWTDGAATHQYEERPGGWGFVVVMNNDAHEEIKSQGGTTGTTNNQMELEAMIEAMLRLMVLGETHKHIIFFSDSEWAVKCLRREQNCTNPNIIHQLNIVRLFAENFIPLYIHVPAHSGLPYNEMANMLAVQAKDVVIAVMKDKEFMARLREGKHK